MAKILDLIQLGGWLTVLIATIQVGHWKIFGVTQALDYLQGRPYTKVHGHRLPDEFFKVGWPVSDKGLWNFARHPDFFGFCTAFWVTPTMTVGHLVFAIGLTIYIMFGIFFLETNLSQLYGGWYDQYVQIRSKIIPWLVPRRRGWLLFRIVTVILFLIALFALIAAAAILLLGDNTQQAGKVKDEAMLAGRDVASLPAAEEDYFAAMDGGEKLTPDEVKGRNMWLVWTGGDDRFWDQVTKYSLATFDLLKVITSHPSQTYCDGERCDRDSRWRWLGAINEPCFEKPTGPDPKRFGLWLDVRGANCAPDPFEDESKYPGVKIGARGTTFKDGSSLPVGSTFGAATGVVGLRLFPNPDFDQAAKDKWDAERYYTDPNYYQDPRSRAALPGRHGLRLLSCRPEPDPPAGRPRPSAMGRSQLDGRGAISLDGPRVCLRRGSKEFSLPARAFLSAGHDGHIARLDRLHQQPAHHERGLSSRPPARAGQALGQGDAQGGQLDNKQLPASSTRRRPAGLYQKPYVWSPRVLKDGSDSVGVLAALNRVYINIGLYSEEWMRHFNPFFGGKAITRFRSRRRKPTPPIGARPSGRPFMAEFLVKAGQPDRLADAPGGKYLTADAATLERGKTRVRRDLRPLPFEQAAGRSARKARSGRLRGPRLPRLFQALLGLHEDRRLQGQDARHRRAPDFFKDNFLSTDARIPVTLLRTNACSPLAPTRFAGNIWDNFSSQTYKTLPAVGDGHGEGSVHRGGSPIPHARRRPRLYPSGVARQPVVDRALPPQQFGRRRSIPTRRSRRGWAVSTSRSGRCCGPRPASTTPCSPTSARSTAPSRRAG